MDNDLRSGNPKRLKLGNYYVHGGVYILLRLWVCMVTKLNIKGNYLMGAEKVQEHAVMAINNQ